MLAQHTVLSTQWILIESTYILGVLQLKSFILCNLLYELLKKIIKTLMKTLITLDEIFKNLIQNNNIN